jgi:hypothetical protein
VSRNERDAAITVGTLSVIRRRALEEVGGWAEWCATEDSELAVRLHAAGHSSIYLDACFGRGLIPETFAGYKRQRFRWTFSPVQELRRHHRLFLPRPLARRSALSPKQKLHHLNHGLDRLAVGAAFLLTPVGFAVVGSMLAHHELVRVPFVLWLGVTTMLASGVVLRLRLSRVALRCSLREALGAAAATGALRWTVTLARVTAIVTPTIPWRRTNRFRVMPSGRAFVASVGAELLLGSSLVLAGAGLVASTHRLGLLLMLAIGAILQGCAISWRPRSRFWPSSISGAGMFVRASWDGLRAHHCARAWHCW